MYAEAVAGLGVVAVFGLIIRFQQTRLNKLQDTKRDRRACDQIVEVLKDELNKGSAHFERIDGKLSTMTGQLAEENKQLALVAQQVGWLANQNGYRPEKG